MKKLYKSAQDKKVSGVIGGFAEYLDIDSTLLRVLFILGVIFTGIFPLVIAYIGAALVMNVAPTAPGGNPVVGEQ